MYYRWVDSSAQLLLASQSIEVSDRYYNRYDFRLYAYVLMSNHVHLLAEAGEIPWPK